MSLVVNFIKRYLPIVVLLFLAIVSLDLSSQLRATCWMVVGAEAIAIILSEVAQYAYTKIEWTGAEPQPHGLALIFLGVHMLVGLVIFGVYFAQFQ